MPGGPARDRRGILRRQRRLIAGSIRLALPEWRGRPGDGARVVRDIDAWAASPSLTAVVEASGASLGITRRRERIELLADLSIRWDARAGRERDQADSVELSPELARAVYDSAEVLGQAGRDTPSRDRYDVVIMTAGMVRAQVIKPRFVRELLDRGIRVGEVVFLGASRPFSTDERNLGSALGLRATDEVDSMVEGMERELGPFEPQVDGRGTASGGWWEYRRQSDGMRVRVVSAPSSDPTRRANTADTFRFWAHRGAASVDRVLAVTTPIYVPYQATVAVDVLGRGADLAVETVGATATSLDLGHLSQPFLPQHRLQELRSAILAMRALRAALT